MSKMIDMTIDTKEFEAEFARLVKKSAPKSFVLAVAGALSELRIDAETKEPKVPKAKPGGDLRAQTNVEVEETTDGSAKGELQYKMPYAAYQERGERADGTYVVENYTEPGSGKEFLQKKLIGNQDDYPKVMAKILKKELGIK